MNKFKGVNRVVCLVVISAVTWPVWAAQDRAQLADACIPKLEKMLHENIAAFWLSKSIDRDHGGYTINFGPQGEDRPSGTKMIVTQARTLWLFSRLIRAGYGTDEMVQAARHGYAFLTDKMWDHEHGGFYWEVDVTGQTKRNPLKHMYGQGFALYAISEYSLASKDPAVLAFANRFFELLDTKAYDRVNGGYNEAFLPDWTSASNVTSPMGTRDNEKLMNTHLHLLEALTTYYRASQSPRARERLMELILIQSNTVVRKHVGACTDRYTQDWTPTSTRVSYGHDIENVWLLMDACDAAGQSNRPLLDFYQSLYGYSYQYGYDTAHGGFFDSGEFNQPADRRDKVWWVQAEALVSALYLYRITGDAQYAAVFTQTLDFVDKYMADWTWGEWHSTTSAEGVASPGNKAHAWKCGYHNGRAMIECLEILKAFKPSSTE
ncbi:MAG: AGE family epimerase/isomerase [Phycisphaerae bacterium]|nr:AGE family epimerase/isomerase [Phycisphaerae bacterium]